MDPVSIVIMLLGVAVLAALYYMSLSTQKNVPKAKDMRIHAIRDEEGNLASSVKEDVDGDGQPIESSSASHTANKVIAQTQLVLFIAAKSDEGLNGNKLLNSFEKAGLSYGEMDLFHRMVMTDKGDVSVFSAANGVEPWTLNPDDIRNQSTPGVSLILNLPSLIDDIQAIEEYVYVAQMIAEDLNANLKNQQQEIFSDADKAAMLALVQ